MKYSTAVVAACIGGAALAAAEVTPAHPAPPHTPPKPTRAHSVAHKAGKAVTVLGTYTKHASGNGYNSYGTDASSTSAEPGVYPRKFPLPHFRMPSFSKPKVQETARKGKDLARTAVQAGGGSAAVAENLGNVANYVSSNTQQAQAPVYRRGDEVKQSGRRRKGKKQRLPQQTESGTEKGEASPATVNERDFFEEEELFSRDFDEELEARDYFDDEELAARGFISNLKANWHGRKSADLTKTAAKATAKAAQEQAYAGIEAGTSAPPPAGAAYRREFDDELDARDFDLEDDLAARAFDDDDELLARGFIANLKANWHGRKAKDLQQKAAEETALAGAQVAPPAGAAYRREFDDELLEARDFDYEDELAARDFDDEEELFARGFIANLKANWHGRKAKDFTQKAAEETALAGAQVAPPAPPAGAAYRREFDARDFNYEDALALRELAEYSEALLARGLFADDLEARGLFGSIAHGLGALKDTVLGKKTAPPAGMGMGSDPNAMAVRGLVDADAGALALRDLYDMADELEARAYTGDELEARLFRKLRNGLGALKDTVTGKKPGQAAAGGMGVDPSMGSDPSAMAARGFYEEEDLALRDLYDMADELEAREYSGDELEARLFRKFRNGLGALKDTVLGKQKAPMAPPAAGMDPSSMGSDPNAMAGRDFYEDEDLVLRDVEEYLEARDFEEELDARELFEDELDAREFEIDELD
ncbi:hypothetical protein DXG01_014403 [Tephrocybe rancida]|nr:hypothetical protein DXG01_014403 [Tephrocybe rancida]